MYQSGRICKERSEKCTWYECEAILAFPPRVVYCCPQLAFSTPESCYNTVKGGTFFVAHTLFADGTPQLRNYDTVKGPPVRRWCAKAIRPPCRGKPPCSFQVMSAVPPDAPSDCYRLISGYRIARTALYRGTPTVANIFANPTCFVCLRLHSLIDSSQWDFLIGLRAPGTFFLEVL